MEEVDLRAMSRRDARDYVARHIMMLKDVRKRRAVLQEDFTRWESRVEHARKEGHDELASQAMTRLSEIANSFESLSAEEKELSANVEALKRRLHMIESGAGGTLNVEALSAELERAAGGYSKTDEDLRYLDADAELKNLKRRMNEEKDS